MNYLINKRNEVLSWLYKYISYKNKQNINGSLFFRKVLFIVNPHSGTKKGMIISEETKPLLEANGIDIDLVITEPDPFLEEYMKSIRKEQLIQYDFIICISGDGSAHAILNGFYQRDDIDFSKNPLNLVMIPAGSGCLMFENAIKNGELKDFSFENAIYVCCHPNPIQFQIRKGVFKKRNGEIFERFFYLYVHFGFIADCDSGSETLRFLGTPRFEIYAYYKTFNLSKIPAKIFIPKNNKKLPSLSEDLNDS